jgi:hypothetical protein
MNNDKSTDISVKQVRGFLRDHPTFLDENPDILETMIVAHKPQGAISLVERQLAVLRSRNSEMDEQLNSLYAIAQDNETMFERTNRLVANLLKANNLSELVQSLYDSLGKDYGIEAYSLTLLGTAEDFPKSIARISTPDIAKQEVPSVLSSTNATCGRLNASEMNFLFGDSLNIVGSAAVVILRSKGNLGILALGNSDSEYYTNDMGTIFIDYIAEIISLILPNYLHVQN